jgi:hypothetical protein
MPEESGARIFGAGAQELVGTAKRLGLTWTLRPASVSTVEPLKIVYDGDTEEIGAVSIGGQVAVGQRVHGLIVPPAGNFVIAPTGGPHVFTEGSGAVTQASGSYGNGTGTICGTAFIAPSSGMVTIFWGSEISNSIAGFTLASIEVRRGSVVDSGDGVLAASDANTVRNDNTLAVRSTAFHTLPGLTPGGSYNVTLKYRVGGGTGTFDRRKIVVMPA